MGKDKTYSDSLQRFHELIKDDKIKRKSKKREKEIKDLLYWFVDSCPSKRGSNISKKFIDYGFKCPANYKKLKNKIIEDVGLKKDETYKALKNQSVETIMDDIEMAYKSRRKPIVYFNISNNTEMDTLYSSIRNSFAHGNYVRSRKYYCLWNETVSGNSKKLGSFMVLKYEHLKLIFKALNVMQD